MKTSRHPVNLNHHLIEHRFPKIISKKFPKYEKSRFLTPGLFVQQPIYSRPGIIEHRAKFTFGNKQSPRIFRINSSVAHSGIK